MYCTWAAPGFGSDAGSTSPLCFPRWCPLGRGTTYERGALGRASPQIRPSGGPGCCAVAPPSHPSDVLRLRHRPSNSAALTLIQAPLPPRLLLARRPGRALHGVRLSRAVAAAAVQRALLEWVATTARSETHLGLARAPRVFARGPAYARPDPCAHDHPTVLMRAAQTARAQRADARAQSAHARSPHRRLFANLCAHSASASGAV